MTPSGKCAASHRLLRAFLALLTIGWVGFCYCCATVDAPVFEQLSQSSWSLPLTGAAAQS